MPDDSQKNGSDFILFLGAGASAQFGVPTLNGLTRTALGSLRRYSSRLRTVGKHLKAGRFTNDVEGILCYLEASSSPQDTIVKIGPSILPISGKTKLSAIPEIKSDKKLAFQLRKMIRRSCFINNRGKIQDIQKFYDDFFTCIKRRFELKPIGPKEKNTPDLDVFTTNYDNVIEQYCFAKGLDLIDGYKEVKNHSYLFDEKEFETPNAIRLYKLNGSVLFARVRGLGIVQVQDRLDSSVYGYPLEELLIYPGFSKKYWKEPHLELLYKLKSKLSVVRSCICVGYSFRDENIRDVFLDAVARNPTIKVYLISPEARKIKKQYFNGNPNFITIPKKFENIRVDKDIRR